jgi:hypothetical protein
MLQPSKERRPRDLAELAERLNQAKGELDFDSSPLSWLDGMVHFAKTLRF